MSLKGNLSVGDKIAQIARKFVCSPIPIAVLVLRLGCVDGAANSQRLLVQAVDFQKMALKIRAPIN